MGYSDGPAAADLGAGQRHLGHDFSFGDGGAVELALDDDLQAGGGSGALGFWRGEADELGDGDFAAVDG